jgi:hypothetical protein
MTLAKSISNRIPVEHYISSINWCFISFDVTQTCIIFAAVVGEDLFIVQPLQFGN